MPKLIYAGIGAKITPPSICELMFNIGQYLAENDWILRSGHAQGADVSFEDGAKEAEGQREIYLPWSGFNGASRADRSNRVPPWTVPIFQLAAKHHPAWDKCDVSAQYLHARNGCQILGLDLKTPCQMVICWTKNGAGKGGTGQALRIARAHNIPIFDLAIEGKQDELEEFITSLTPVTE